MQSTAIDADRTPRASIEQTRISTTGQQSSTTTAPNQPATAKPDDEISVLASTAGDAASTIVPSTYAPSTHDAQSTILSSASLLSHDRDTPRTAQQVTTGRKAFEIFCSALDVMFPVDITEGVTSMSDSSIGKIGKAVQEGLTGRRRASTREKTEQ